MHTHVHRHSHSHPDELASLDGREYLYGVPVLDGTNHGNSNRLCLGVQRNFLQYLVDLAVKSLETANVEADVPAVDFVSNRLYERLRSSLVMPVVERVGSAYRAWFETQANSIGQQQFKAQYDHRAGYQKLFEELFPDMPIAQFLQECLNGVDVSALGVDVQVQAEVRDLILKCLDS